MNCWTLLELTAEADERAVKRSYAKLLKIHRPDGDLVAFQRLRDAYETALSIVQRRAAQQEPNSPQPTQLTPTLPLISQQPVGIKPIREEPLRSERYSVVDELVTDLRPDNLSERWTSAIQQQHATEFEYRLLSICLSSMSRYAFIAEWAVRELNWLGFLQRIKPTPDQYNQLIQVLCFDCTRHLVEALNREADADFLVLVLGYKQRPWLINCHNSQLLEKIVLDALSRAEFSDSLLLQLASFFEWASDNQRFALINMGWSDIEQRLAPLLFLKRLSELAKLPDQDRRRHPNESAAYLFTQSLTQKAQIEFVRNFSEEDWQACEALNNDLVNKYPSLLSKLPTTEWQALQPLTLSSVDNYWVVIITVWLCFFCSLHFLWLDHMANAQPTASIVKAASYSFYGLLVGAFVIAVNNVWSLIAGLFLRLDNGLSKRLVPSRLTKLPRWRVLRNGVPLLTAIISVYCLTGIVGLLAYAGLRKIRRVQVVTAGEATGHSSVTAKTHNETTLVLKLSLVSCLAVAMCWCLFNLPLYPFTFGLDIPYFR